MGWWGCMGCPKGGMPMWAMPGWGASPMWCPAPCIRAAMPIGWPPRAPAGIIDAAAGTIDAAARAAAACCC